MYLSAALDHFGFVGLEIKVEIAERMVLDGASLGAKLVELRQLSIALSRLTMKPRLTFSSARWSSASAKAFSAFSAKLLVDEAISPSPLSGAARRWPARRSYRQAPRPHGAPRRLISRAQARRRSA